MIILLEGVYVLEDLVLEYEKLQNKYGDPNLDSITFGGCLNNPDVCLVFMNPTARNITSSKDSQPMNKPYISSTLEVSKFFVIIKI